MTPIPPTTAPIRLGTEPGSMTPTRPTPIEPATMSTPMIVSATPQRESGRQLGLGLDLEGHRDLTGQRRPELECLQVQGAQALDARPDDRQWVRGRMCRSQAGQLLVDLDRLPEPLVAILCGVTLAGQALGLACLLEHAPPLGEDGLGLRSSFQRARQRIAVAGELGQRQISLFEGLARLGRFGFGDLQAARVLLALGREVVERPLQLPFRTARATVATADRRLEPVAEGTLVMPEIGKLVMTHRGGRAEERLGGDARQLGQDLVGEGRVGDGLAVVVEADRAARPGKGLLELAHLRTVLVLLVEVDRDDRSGVVGGIPGAEGIQVPGSTRDPPRHGELDGPLDGRLPGLVRAADDRQARREVDGEVAVPPEVVELEPADPHSDTS